jgi:hypothetical protein
MRHRLAAASLFALAVTAPAQNQGLSLTNGTTAYVDVPYSPTLVPTGGITVEAWVTYGATPLPSGWRFPTIVRGDPTPNQSSYFLRVEAGQTQTNRLLWWVTTTNGNYTVGYNFTAGALLTWTHVAGTYDGSTLRLFVNGAQVAQSNGTGPIRDYGGGVRIGSGDLTVNGGETWNGEIDEVRIWPFARSAAAIASAMNTHLHSMPGEVSTWNLDGNAQDSSGLNHGTAVGTSPFAANTLALQTIATSGAWNFGAGTGCRTTGLAAVPAVATVGNAAFGFVGTRAPAGQGGFALLALATLPAPFPILGIDVLVDLNAGVSLFLFANAIGTSSVVVAIPADPSFVTVSLAAQYVWLDTTCPNGLSASNGVVVSILP